MKKTWPFGEDSDQDDLLTPLRIAVAGPYAEWCYLVTFDRESPVRPTEQEALMLASFLDEYKSKYYGEHWMQRLASKPLDVDSVANGMTFRKYADNDWGYRRRSWNQGPMFIPQPPAFKDRAIGPLSLVELMDHIHEVGGAVWHGWIKWKSEHSDIFGG